MSTKILDNMRDVMQRYFHRDSRRCIHREQIIIRFIS